MSHQTITFPTPFNANLANVVCNSIRKALIQLSHEANTIVQCNSDFEQMQLGSRIRTSVKIYPERNNSTTDSRRLSTSVQKCQLTRLQAR